VGLPEIVKGYDGTETTVERPPKFSKLRGSYEPVLKPLLLLNDVRLFKLFVCFRQVENSLHQRDNAENKIGDEEQQPGNREADGVGQQEHKPGPGEPEIKFVDTPTAEQDS